MCQTNGCTVRLVQDLLPAQSVIANTGLTATWLASLRMILPSRLSLFKTLLGGGGLWDDQRSRGLGRSIRPVVMNLRWAESLPGDLP